MIIERAALCFLMAASLVLIAGCKEKSPTGKAVDVVKGTVQKTTDAVTDGAKKVGEGAEKVYDKTKDAVKDGAQAVTDGVKKGVEKTGEAIDKAGERSRNWGSDPPASPLSGRTPSRRGTRMIDRTEFLAAITAHAPGRTSH